MANATTAPSTPETVTIEGQTVKKNSPEHKALSQEFDTSKKYVFELAVKNMESSRPAWDMRANRPAPSKPFMPRRNLVYTSQIVWNGQRRMIRYYDGCTSIFVDEQPKEKDMIDMLIKQTIKKDFLDGKLAVWGYERMLLLYMTICSWNGDSPFRTKTAAAVFVPVNSQKIASAAASKIDETEKALQLAKEATKTKMMIHAGYLGIPMVDYDSGNELTEDEIRAEYRKEALRNSASFIESYGNKAIEVQYFIDKAWERGDITNKFNPNKATWGKSNTVICDISGLKSPEAITQRIFEFSQTQEGEEFVIQLKAISE